MVVTVQSAEDTPITGVVDFVVVVSNDDSTTQLTYTVPADQSPLTITNASIVDPKTGVAGKTFSVSFTIGHSGDATFQVTARDVARCTIGLGQNHQIIARGGVANVTVTLTHASGPCENGDAGADSANGVVFPGCDPAAPHVRRRADLRRELRGPAGPVCHRAAGPRRAGSATSTATPTARRGPSASPIPARCAPSRSA